ncbi:ABC transporter ATP-binding protein [Nonomuraea sp. NPDC050643]|uniref:ABC transporter ATP-binding protein n=1 Tax=Nonomuraea sp. NPDC050643 TaxID=3155660 RepID=UPI0033DAF647
MEDQDVRVEGLRQRYGAFEAVRGVSFRVRQGELFALLGTNGAGKTTTLEALEGYRPAAGGTVRVLGRDPYRERRRVRGQMGIMLQEGGFFADLTVAETVDFWRSVTPRPRDRGEVLGQVGLGERGKVRVRQLSGGQRRALELALAVLGRPRVLFLDEPTAGMDPQLRHSTWELIRRIRAGGVTVVLITHYLEEAERLADHLAIMHRGRIEAAGTIEEVLAGRGDSITFVLPPGLAVERLPVLRGTACTLSASGERTRVLYALPGQSLQEAMYELLRWADERRVVLDLLQARHASLEDVFFDIAGDRLSDVAGDRLSDAAGDRL